MSGIPSLTILSEEQKFNGENLLQWSTNMTQLLGSKGILGYINGSIPKPDPPVSPSPASEPAATTTPTSANLGTAIDHYVMVYSTVMP